MKWKVCLRERLDLKENSYTEREILVSDPFYLSEAVKTVEILMQPSMFGNEKLWKISIEPVKEG